MARFQLEVGPIPLHHQVYLDLQAALESGEFRHRKPPSHRARAGCALWLQPDHRPSRARRAGARGPDRTHSRPRHLRPFTAHRAQHRRRPELRRGDAAARAGAGDPHHHLAVERAGETVALAMNLQAGSPVVVPRADSAGRGRADDPGAGPVAGPSVPGSAGPRPGGAFAVRRAGRLVRRPGRSRPGNGRAGAAARPRGAPARRSAAVAGTAGRRVAYRQDGTPVEAARSFVRSDRSRYYLERAVARASWTDESDPPLVAAAGLVGRSAHDVPVHGGEEAGRDDTPDRGCPE